MSISVSVSVSTVLQSPGVHFTHFFTTRDRCTHALCGSTFVLIGKCQTPSSHVHPPSVRHSGLILVAELLEEATLSGRLCERKDDGTAWSWNPRLLRCVVTERGTTGAGEPQITRVPRVHRTLELHGCGTREDNIRLGCNGICPLTSLATIHGSPVMNRAKLSHHGIRGHFLKRFACVNVVSRPTGLAMVSAARRAASRAGYALQGVSCSWRVVGRRQSCWRCWLAVVLRQLV